MSIVPAARTDDHPFIITNPKTPPRFIGRLTPLLSFAPVWARIAANNPGIKGRRSGTKAVAFPPWTDPPEPVG